jgi:hypothetical protein
MDRNEILNQVKREIEPQVLEGYFDQILINRVVDATLKAINYSQCCETLKDKKDEISDLAKTFINEVDKKHPFVNLPEEEDFYMARHKLAEKLT